MAITILELAEHRLGRKAETGQDFADAGLQIMGGCERCHASVAAYNACPSKSGSWRCEDCIGDSGYETVEEANQEIFGTSVQLLDKEAAFIIEALRYWQRDMDQPQFVSELTTEQIDALCERINS